MRWTDVVVEAILITLLTSQFVYGQAVAIPQCKENTVSTPPSRILEQTVEQSLQKLKFFGTITEVTGQVFAVGTHSRNSRQLHLSAPIFYGDKISTDKQSTVKVKLNNGSVMSMGQNSIINLPNSSNWEHANESSNDTNNLFLLIKGSMWLREESKENLVDHEKSPKPVVRTRTVQLAVRGTVFSVWVNKDGTYNKVYKGGTTLKNSFGEIDVNIDQVGFAARDNAPRILSHEPDFLKEK